MAGSSMPRIGLGTAHNTDPDVCARSVRIALDMGYRHIDTAEIYGNEAAVGRGLAAAEVDRDDVFIATKVGPKHLDHDSVIEHARASADRLGINVIDLLYVHWPTRTYDPASTLGAFDQLYEAGAIRHVGVSNFTPELLDEALSTLQAPLSAHQVECHPLLQQEELRRYAREFDHSLVAYSPLMKGGVTSVPELTDIATKHDATAAQVSLAWLLSKDHVAVIPKASSTDHIRENLEAAELRLDDEDSRRIDAIDRTDRQVDRPSAPWN